MATQTATAGGLVAIPRPPAMLKTPGAKKAWRYLLAALSTARLDYGPALMSLALLSDKIDSWRKHMDAIAKAGKRYEIDSNKGSLESDESLAERRARAEVIKDLEQSGLTVISAAHIRALDQLGQGDLFSPFDAATDVVTGNRSAETPPWSLTKTERAIWREMVAQLEGAGFDFATAGISLGLLCAAVSDWHDCKKWIEDNGGKHFAVSYATGRTYEVSASYNRAKIAKQIRELLKKNGMTVYSCAKNKAISKGRIAGVELLEILAFVGDRLD